MKGQQEIKVWDRANMGGEGIDEGRVTRAEPNRDKTEAETRRR